MKEFIVIHNSSCSKCSQTMQMLEERGSKIQVINYLTGELTKDLLLKALKALNVRPKEVLRTKEEEFQKLNLDPNNDEEVIHAILKHPKILVRPIVIQGERAVIGRPPENILKLF